MAWDTAIRQSMRAQQAAAPGVQPKDTPPPVIPGLVPSQHTGANAFSQQTYLPGGYSLQGGATMNPQQKAAYDAWFTGGGALQSTPWQYPTDYMGRPYAPGAGMAAPAGPTPQQTQQAVSLQNQAMQASLAAANPVTRMMGGGAAGGGPAINPINPGLQQQTSGAMQNAGMQASQMAGNPVARMMNQGGGGPTGINPGLQQQQQQQLLAQFLPFLAMLLQPQRFQMPFGMQGNTRPGMPQMQQGIPGQPGSQFRGY